ncbi:MAG TPA: alpha/beta hydrolase [Burkholderiaceae bacterium]|nr:alpha/beta hydrolase [Burkholderiaceae bacterium]
MSHAVYTPRRKPRQQFVPVRGLRYHLTSWGSPDTADNGPPPLVMLHGWMDVSSSFQFVVDAMGDERHIVAPDWRGFGLTETPVVDTYWFPDYLGDLDALLASLFPGRRIDLLGHSMGANVAMLFAGIRPDRIRRLVNLEGFGMPEGRPEDAPARYRQWLDELAVPEHLKRYESAAEVATRLRKTNPRLTPDKAAWLATQWAREGADGQWRLLADPAHKRINPVLYRKEEALACWRAIEAEVLWIEGEETDISKWWGDRYSRAEFEARISHVPDLRRERLASCGHMLHHDQPQGLARLLEEFLS